MRFAPPNPPRPLNSSTSKPVVTRATKLRLQRLKEEEEKESEKENLNSIPIIAKFQKSSIQISTKSNNKTTIKRGIGENSAHSLLLEKKKNDDVIVYDVKGFGSEGVPRLSTNQFKTSNAANKQQKRPVTRRTNQPASMLKSIKSDSPNFSKKKSPSRRLPLNSLPLSISRIQKAAVTEKYQNNKYQNGCSTRRNLDKRTARLLYREEFKDNIQQFRNRNQEEDLGTIDVVPPRSHDVQIYIRKRPLFGYELDRGDYDVVSFQKSSSSFSHNHIHNSVVVQNCIMKADMKSKIIQPIEFPSSAAFDEFCSNEDVFREAVSSKVAKAVCGGISTILMYGATGTGKSYTMSGIEKGASRGVFEEARSHALSQALASKKDDALPYMPKITVQFIELAGKVINDLLGVVKIKKKNEVKLSDGKGGTVKLVNATSVIVSSPEEMMRAIKLGKSRRATESTDMNGVSSRSHAVCRILIDYYPDEEVSDVRKPQRGILTLIDCAGSERKNDSLYHSSDRQKETNEINASLYSLKECIRARTKSSRSEGVNNSTAHIPYRSSTLTRVLRESFEDPNAQLCVIATVAPNATDTEHTIETLRTVAKLVGLEKSVKDLDCRKVSDCETNIVTSSLPRDWTEDELEEWLSKKSFFRAKLPQGMNGRKILKLSNIQLKNMVCAGDGKLADGIFKELRNESERVAKLQLKQRQQSKINKLL